MRKRVKGGSLDIGVKCKPVNQIHQRVVKSGRPVSFTLTCSFLMRTPLRGNSSRLTCTIVCSALPVWGVCVVWIQWGQAKHSTCQTDTQSLWRNTAQSLTPGARTYHQHGGYGAPFVKQMSWICSVRSFIVSWTTGHSTIFMFACSFFIAQAFDFVD